MVSPVQGTSKGETEQIWKKLYLSEPYELTRTSIQKVSRPGKCTQYDLLSAIKRQIPLRITQTTNENAEVYFNLIKNYTAYHVTPGTQTTNANYKLQWFIHATNYKCKTYLVSPATPNTQPRIQSRIIAVHFLIAR